MGRMGAEAPSIPAGGEPALLGLLMRRVLVAPPAVFAHLDAIWIVLLVLDGRVIAALTHAAGQGDDVFHSQKLLGGKKKA
jgi:hypothetical protein